MKEEDEDGMGGGATGTVPGKAPKQSPRIGMGRGGGGPGGPGKRMRGDS